MISRAKQKVKEGKVVKVEIDSNSVINDVKITGDFFLYPEDILEEIEKCIIGLDKTVSEEEILSGIQKATAGKDVQMIGISPESIAMLIKEVLE
jgi:lipoate-protein ligase A